MSLKKPEEKGPDKNYNSKEPDSRPTKKAQNLSKINK
jgi:hypothetical protein